MREIIYSIEAEYRRYKVLGEGAIRQTREDELSKSLSTDGNSIAVLVWHISGNLKSRFTDFLTSDGEKPWRNRDSEFEPRSGVMFTKLWERWDDGWAVLFSVLQSLSDADLSRTVTIRGVEFRVHEALHRLLAHTSYHVGQIVYLARTFRGSEWKTLSIPLGRSEEYNRNPTSEKFG